MQAAVRRLFELARLTLLLAAPAVLAGAACGDASGSATDAGPTETSPTEASTTDAGPSATHAMMRFGSAANFWDAPMPSDHRLDDEGRVNLQGFPNPGKIKIVGQSLALLHQKARGFSTTAGVFFRIGPEGATLDRASLPDLAGSVRDDASVYLIALEQSADDAGRRYPVDVTFREAASKFGASRLLTLLPLQGVPLRPRRRYAAVVTRRVRDGAGASLGAGREMRDIDRGVRPEGMSLAAFARYRAALDRLVALGERRDEIVALAVFTTDDPTRGLAEVVKAMRARALPVPTTPFQRREVFADYCVYEARYELPVYQNGVPPYLSEGGGFELDARGVPKLVRVTPARLFLTVPRTRAMPPGGWPTAVFIRTGGGGDRPLIDRGRRAQPGGAAVAPGSGPALELARAGFAGVSIDGPHGGPLRNKSGGDEQFLVFNISNPTALRDNLRQSAAELTLLPDMLRALSLELDDCALPAGAGGGTARYRVDADKLVLMGHSMGATIAPLTMAEQPDYRALILSGAGGSWIENVMYKLQPLAVRPIAEALVRAPLQRDDPFLNLLQWAGEPADTPVYARRVTGPDVVGGARHVLMLQGIVDRYILPPIANAMSISLGLDLAGDALDTLHPELRDFRPASDVLGYGGARAIALPARANRTQGASSATLVVTQHAEDGVEDGHEVMFQRDEPKAQYRCFLSTFAEGDAPLVPEPKGACP